MYIKKLTITPLYRGFKPIYRFNPSVESATMLIKDKLQTIRNNDIPKRLIKLPRDLRGWVSPETLVII